MAGSTYNLYIKGQDDTRAAITSAKRNFRSLERSVKGVAAAIATVTATRGIGDFLKNITDTADQVGKLSTRLGASTEALSQYQFVAEQTGVSFQTLTTGIQRLTRRASEAAAGTKTYATALAELGINAQRFAELRPEQQFEVLATALDRVENSSRRVALAQKLLDSEGVALLQTMEGGAEAIQALREQADSLGRTINQNTAQAAARLNDNMNLVSSAIEGAALSIASDFLPAINSMSNYIASTVLPNLERLFRRFFDIEKQISEMNLRELELEFQDLVMRVRELDDIAETGGSWWNKLFGLEPGEAAAEAERLRDRMGDILSMVQELRTGRQTPTAPELPEGVFQDPLMPVSDEKHEENIQKKEKQTRDMLDIQSSAYDALLGGVRLFERQFTKETTKGLTERQKFQQMNLREQATDVFQHLASITQGVAQHNRALFEINRVAAIANAIINAQEGASLTLAKYPWPLAGILAAIHYAAGAARVAAIASTSYGGGGGGSAPSLATGGTPVTPVTETGETLPVAAAGLEEEQGPTEITVNFTGIADANSIRELIDAINDEQDNGYVLNIA